MEMLKNSAVIKQKNRGSVILDRDSAPPARRSSASAILSIKERISGVSWICTIIGRFSFTVRQSGIHMDKREFVSNVQTPFCRHVLLYFSVLNMQYMRTASVDQLHIMGYYQHGHIFIQRAKKLRCAFHTVKIQTACRFVKYK